MRMTELQKEMAGETVVLIVDDVTRNLEILGSILGEAGFRIAVATGGRQAISIASSKRPDLILMDISMPEMDGYTACKKLKENPATSGIPVIFLTAHREDQEIIRGFEAGGVDFITKPFKKEELLARILTHAELKKSRERIVRQNEELRKLNSAKDKFVSIIAHDLRNPAFSFHILEKIFLR